MSQQVLMPFDYAALDPPYQWFHGFNLEWNADRQVKLVPAKSASHAASRLCPKYVARWPATFVDVLGARIPSLWDVVLDSDFTPWLVGPGFTKARGSDILGRIGEAGMDELHARILEVEDRCEELRPHATEAA